jgi:beta-catenin-like protein 1
LADNHSQQYRKRDPSDSDEFEYLDNLFDCLSSCLLEADNKALFSQSEGVDLMILMLKYVVDPEGGNRSPCSRENTEGRFRALKALDYALSGPSGALNCKTLVEAGGLKPVFSIFTGTGKFAAKAKHLASEASSHCIGILSSLLTFLPRDSVEQIRLLAKFVEKDYAAVDKVLELREAAVKRLAGTNRSIESQKQV